MPTRGGKFYERDRLLRLVLSPSSSFRQSFSPNSIKSPLPPRDIAEKERLGRGLDEILRSTGARKHEQCRSWGLMRGLDKAQTRHERRFYARAAPADQTALYYIYVYNDSFRWLVTRVRRINWSCYSVAARQDPNRARSRVQPSRLRAKGVAKGVQEENDSSFTAHSRRRRKYRLVLCDFEMPLRTAFFKSTLFVGHTGVENHFYGSTDRRRLKRNVI